MDRSKKRVNKSSKRSNLLNGSTADVSINRPKNFERQKRFSNPKKEPKPTIKSIEVSTPKLLGHWQSDIYGRNLVLDGCEGIRVYNLPIEIEDKVDDTEESEEAVVDDWEALADDVVSSKKSLTTVNIPDCFDLDFDLLKGYVPIKDGGNVIGLRDVPRDRTAGMRWLVKHHQKFKCDNRLFDIDFFAGTGAIRSIMTLQFNQYKDAHGIAVILFMGTYYLFQFDVDEKAETELNNRRSFSGLRFEDHISRGLDGSENEPSTGDRNNYNDAMKYYNVVQFNFDIFKMLMSGEMDCVLPGSAAAKGETPRADDFVEIKTSAPLEDKYDQSRMSHIFRCFKVSSWFAQCVLMGVKHVVVGIREEEADCEKITVKRTHAFTIEELRRNSNGRWSKNRCFDELKKFLHVVKEKVTVDDPEIINVFVVKDGSISGPEMKKLADDPIKFPDISEVVEMMKTL